MTDLSNAVIIGNPTAAGGRVGRRWADLAEGLRAILGPVRIVRTEGPGHATTLAREAVWAGRDVILSLGGDGTHSEVVAGVVRDRPAPGAITVGVLPCGTGGDFRRMIAGSSDVLDHARRLAAADAHEIDVGVLRYASPQGDPTERVFLNEASAGISGLVCAIVNRSRRRLGGTATFYLAALQALTRYVPVPVAVVIDGVEVARLDANLVLLGNGQYGGGGMHLAPHARLGDGLIDVTAIRQDAFLRMVALSPRLYDGSLHRAGLVSAWRGLHVEIRPTGRGETYVEADGEDLAARLPIAATTLGGAIRMIGVRPEVL